MPHVIRCERPISKDPLIPSMEIVQVVKMVTCQFEDLDSAFYSIFPMLELRLA